MKRPISYRIIEDVTHWWEMDGETDLIKKLNSLLCFYFILSNHCPSDECLSEARKIVKDYGTNILKHKVKLRAKLKKHFFYGKNESIIDEAVGGVIALCLLKGKES
jgi:hypothetical protein